MVNRRHQFGKAGELIAARFLRKMGYHILEQNYRTVLGEIDIIARDRDTLVFVEVKARTSGRYGNPKSAVTPRKQRKISMVALHYLKSTSQSRVKARFDVVAIHSAGTAPQIELIKNAFELAYE
jgi:putative endonuclease